MEEYTKSNPGCYHDAVSYLSELSGIVPYKEIEVSSLDKLYAAPHKYAMKKRKKLKYKSYDIYPVDEKGQRYSFIENNKRFDERGIVAVKFMVNVSRSQQEFGIPIKPEGKYNDSLGGGWSQNVALYSINGKFFADMDCACC